MKKRITATLLSILACLMFTVPMFTISVGATSDLPRVLDDADLLNDSEEYDLLDKLDYISEEYQCDVIVVTLEDLDGYRSAQAAADDIFDYEGYGYGSSDSGILLLVSIADRDWAISTYGKGIQVFTDKNQSYMVNEFKPYLSSGDYYSAFDCYADLCQELLIDPNAFVEYYDEYNNGYSTSNSPLELIYIPIALGLGTGLSLLIAFGMRSTLKSVKPQKSAANYVRSNSMVVTNQRENYLYKNVTKTKIESSSSSGGSRGGSSVHRSSSGRSHGGSSGKF